VWFQSIIAIIMMVIGSGASFLIVNFEAQKIQAHMPKSPVGHVALITVFICLYMRLFLQAAIFSIALLVGVSFVWDAV